VTWADGTDTDDVKTVSSLLSLASKRLLSSKQKKVKERGKSHFEALLNSQEKRTVMNPSWH
jgi:hypothetical protein